MNLSAIVAAVPTTQQLLDYQNSCATVNQYAYAITNTNLPVLMDPPPNYGDFANEFAPAKAHCLQWTTSIFPTMLSFPTTIITQAADLFSMEDNMAASWLDILVNDPTNENAKGNLDKAIVSMQSVVQSQLATAEGLLSSMNTFAADIQTDAATLNTIAAQALAAAGGDEADINNLDADIAGLKNQIAQLNKMLTTAEIGIAVSIYVGLIGAVCCVIPGAEGIGAGMVIIGVAGTTASITGTVLLNKEVQDKNAQIQFDQKEIEQLNQDIVALQSVNSQFQWLEAANVATQEAIIAVIGMWQSLDDELAAVQSELATMEVDATKEQYQQAQSDLASAAAAWQEVIDFANALAGVSYNWQDSAGVWHSYTSQPAGADSATVAMLPSSVAVAA